MSLYTFAAANLTTSADCKRRPAVNLGQVTRTIALLALVLAATSLTRQHMHSPGNGGNVPVLSVDP